MTDDDRIKRLAEWASIQLGKPYTDINGVGVIIVQCRCMDLNKPIRYSICAKCLKTSVGCGPEKEATDANRKP